MTSFELFARFSPVESSGILEWLQETDRPAYKTCAGLLAGRRKLRPIFVERKAKPERNAWISENLARPTNADLSAEVLQSWLFGTQGAMVCEFLDALKIPHDGKGLIETLPDEPPADEIDRAVDQLFANHPTGAVVVYLHLFAGMDMTDWPHLKSLVATDPRLCQNHKNP